MNPDDLNVSIIVAYSKNRVIGNKTNIPWNIPEDQKRFKELTTGNIIIMGRITFCDILKKLNKPLPNRTTLVISNSTDFQNLGCKTFHNLQDALFYCSEKYSQKQIFICGGSMLYKEALPIAKTIYTTQIQKDYDGDAYFPEIPEKEYTVQSSELISEPVPYKYVTYIKK